jgi:hypothetical protein
MNDIEAAEMFIRILKATKCRRDAIRSVMSELKVSGKWCNKCKRIKDFHEYAGNRFCRTCMRGYYYDLPAKPYPTKPERVEVTEAHVQRFMAKIKKRGDGCWEWTAAKSSGGYPVFLGYSATHFSYAAYKGKLCVGLVVDHLCCNRACVNPDHLEQVTQKENMRRRGHRQIA